MKEILIATHNQAKLKELIKGVESLIENGVKVVSLKDLKIAQEPEETGKTFCENALIKAKFYGDLTQLPTIADDGGLTIDVLGGQPGIKSRRWIGENSTDEERINYTLKRMKNLPKGKRTAYIKTAVCFYSSNNKIIICEENKIKGHIADKPSKKRIKHYPYRSLFIIDKYDKYYDELTSKEHDEINHRLKATRKLASKIIQRLKIA